MGFGRSLSYILELESAFRALGNTPWEQILCAVMHPEKISQAIEDYDESASKFAALGLVLSFFAGADSWHSSFDWHVRVCCIV